MISPLMWFILWVLMSTGYILTLVSAYLMGRMDENSKRFQEYIDKLKREAKTSGDANKSRQNGKTKK